MIEVPAAALALPSFIGSVDFLSIGTNDLVQYLLAADRNNDALGDLYTPLHPARFAVAARRDPPVARCATSPLPSAAKWPAIRVYAPLLLALGLTEFSLHPNTLLEVRRGHPRMRSRGTLRSRLPLLMRARDRGGHRGVDAGAVVVA